MSASLGVAQEDELLQHTGVSESDYSFYPMASVEAGGKADVEVRMVGMDVKQDDNHLLHVNGHIAWLNNPAGHFSVSEPLPGGCGNLVRVSDVAKLHSPKCRVATNGGLFNVHNKKCFGNVVADGKIVQTEPLTRANANFGIKDGKFVVGYLSPDDIAKGGFEQLITGLDWLVRDGRNYVKESWAQAYTDVQTSGAGEKYMKMVSGRTALGFDRDGRLIIFQVDGDARGVHSYGLKLTQMADLLIEKFNVTNAVAMDSGGSTSFVQDGILINYGSDNRAPSCPIGPPYECERPTSTVLCIHDGYGVSDVVLSDGVESDGSPSALPGAGFFGLALLLCFGGAVCGALLMGLGWKRKQPLSLARQLSPGTDSTQDA